MLDVSPLIATKFHIPPAHTDLVPRERLRAMLETGARQPLTLISAPPGFGKTMLVAEWIHTRAGEPVAWLALDENDNQLLIFWRYLIAALQSVQPGLGESARQMLAAPLPPPVETIATMLINEIAAQNRPLGLVLDDYHLIRSVEIHHSLNFLLDHQPANFHLVLLTREDPPLGLARRRARRQMMEIRAADLRFTPDEAAAFLQTCMGLALNPQQTATLESRTEGWIVGLQMAALSLQGRDPQAFFDSFSGDDRYIADYLIEEVLLRQPESVRNFLLKTSILEQFCTPLCAALLEVPEVDLPGLERANLFVVPLDSTRTWYRYHHLFAELLRQRLQDTCSAAEISRLQRAASQWYEAHGDIYAALRHARQIPDMKRVAQLLQQNVGLFFQRSELPQLVRLASDLPAEQRQAYPHLCMAVAWAALAANQAPAPWLECVERHFGLPAEDAVSPKELDPAVRAGLLEVLIVGQQAPFTPLSEFKHARLAAIQQQMQAFPPEQFCLFNTISSLQPVVQYDLGLDAEWAGQAGPAAGYFSESARQAREKQNTHLLFLSLAHLASIQAAQARLSTARQTHEQILALYTTGSTSPYAALAHAGLAALFYEWGDLPAAELHLNEGLALARSWNHWESLIPITLCRARLENRRGSPQKALAILDELKEPPHRQLLEPVEALRALYLARSGDTASAAAWLAASSFATHRDREPSPLNETALLDVCRLLLLLNRPGEALALAQRLCHWAEAGGRGHSLIQAQVLQAKTLALQGQSAGALDVMQSALHLAEPEDYLSTFVDEGDTLRALLTRLSGDAYAARILSAFDGAQDRPARPESGDAVADSLSEREREVLGLMAAGLANQAIAERLVISITTVKTHISNIFNKLGVSSRMQAVARAEALGLLPRR